MSHKKDARLIRVNGNRTHLEESTHMEMVFFIYTGLLLKERILQVIILKRDAIDDNHFSFQ